MQATALMRNHPCMYQSTAPVYIRGLGLLIGIGSTVPGILELRLVLQTNLAIAVSVSLNHQASAVCAAQQ